MKTLLIFGVIVGVLGIKNFLKSNDEYQSTFHKVSAEEFVFELEKLGYFKYAENENVDQLKANMIEYYDPSNELVTIWNEDTGVPLDYRYYGCDGETLFEAGGFIEMLNEVSPTFNKIGLQFKVTDHLEEWDNENKWLNHCVTVNGTKYKIFENFQGYGWGEAALRFAQIVNKEAEKQSIDEKIYLVSGGNVGRLVFLTLPQYEFIFSVYKNKEWKPLEVAEWMKVMNVKPM